MGTYKDYVEQCGKSCNKKPEDYVIATGKQYSIRVFTNMVCKKLGFDISWNGNGVNEKVLINSRKKTIIEIDKNYFRPLDVNTLLGNASKARRKLKWKPKYNLNYLIDEMISKKIILINENQ